MCGRYASRESAADLALRFRIHGPLPDVAPSWNIAPSQDAPVIRRHPATGVHHLDLLNWGLLPHWTKDRKSARRPINARAETLATSAFFRGAFAARRAIVPADAFYEWQRSGTHKQPYAIARNDRDILAMAGIWEGWRSPDGGTVRSFAIVTTSANTEMAPIHDRMPVILAPAEWDIWLDGPPDQAVSLLRPAPAATLRLWPISTRVNKPSENDPELLEPL
jgi:putative SOS response-associated peptidase YedK